MSAARRRRAPAPWFRRATAPVVGLACLVSLGGSGGSGAKELGRTLEGTDEVVLVLPPEAKANGYRNAGYRLETDGELARVSVDLSPLQSRTPFRVPSDLDPRDPFVRLASRLVTGDHELFEAVSHVLGWVAGNIRYDLDRGAEQSAERVLARGSAYCTGISRLTVALLRAIGIEAREVPGWVADDGSTPVSGYHRWVEVLYPDRGWVFSDPLYSHNFVPATYVPLASETLQLAAGEPVGEGTVASRTRRLEIADVYPFAPASVVARRNDSRQIASTVRVAVEPELSGTLLLASRSREWRLPLESGTATFVGLDAGRYDLSLELADGRRFGRHLRLAPTVRSVLTFRVGAPAEPGGRVATEPASRRW